MDSITPLVRRRWRASLIGAAVIAASALPAAAANAATFSGQFTQQVQPIQIPASQWTLSLGDSTQTTSTALVDLTQGGTLTVAFSGDWSFPSAQWTGCPSGQKGGKLVVSGISPGTQLSVSFTAKNGKVTSGTLTAPSTGYTYAIASDCVAQST